MWKFLTVCLAVAVICPSEGSAEVDRDLERTWSIFDPSPNPPPKGKWCFTRTIVSEDKDHNISTQDIEICCPLTQLPTDNTDPKKQSCVAWTPAPGRDLCTPQQIKDKEFEVCTKGDKSWLACCDDGFVPVCSSENDPNKPRCARPEQVEVKDGIAADLGAVDTEQVLQELYATADSIEQHVTDEQALAVDYDYAAALVSELEQSSSSYEAFVIANQGELPLNDGVELHLADAPDLGYVSKVKGNSIDGCWDRVKRLITIRVQLGITVLPHQAAAAAACCAANSDRGYFINIPMFCAIIYGRDLTLQGYKSCVEYGIAPSTLEQCIFGISGYPRIGAFIKNINPSTVKPPIQIGR